jgi:hypothetical protein
MSSITPIPFPFYNSLGVSQSEFFENKNGDTTIAYIDSTQNDLLPQYITFIDEDEKCTSQNCDLDKLKKNIQISSASTVKNTEKDKDEDKADEKYGGFYTQLYITSLTVVGLYVVYRLMKR